MDCLHKIKKRTILFIPCTLQQNAYSGFWLLATAVTECSTDRTEQLT